MSKVLVTSRSFGQVSQEPVRYLEEHGFQVSYYNHEYEEEVFIEHLTGCEGLIVGAHPVTERVFLKTPGLRCVVKHGAGLDNIDLEAAKRNNVLIDNVPSTNSDAVADLTMGLIIDVARKISGSDRKVREGLWEKAIGVDAYAKTLSLIGFGTIGRKVAKRARGFSMRILAYDPYLKEIPDEFRDFVALSDFRETIAEADFLSLHLPLTSETRDLMDNKEMALMKQGSFLINTSRGGIVNEKALVQALDQGKLRGAALDVLEEEPLPISHPLRGRENVTITSHIGMYSEEAINAVSMQAAQKLVAALKPSEDRR
jgi:D-3-phosphoglycerate dehydrogenase